MYSPRVSRVACRVCVCGLQEGFYEFVHRNESMEEKVMRQLNRAMQPALTNLALTWKGLKVRQSPHRLSPLFAGGRIVVYAFPQDGESQTGQSTLSPYREP